MRASFRSKKRYHHDYNHSIHVYLVNSQNLNFDLVYLKNARKLRTSSSIWARNSLIFTVVDKTQHGVLIPSSFFFLIRVMDKQDEKISIEDSFFRHLIVLTAFPLMNDYSLTCGKGCWRHILIDPFFRTEVCSNDV